VQLVCLNVDVENQAGKYAGCLAIVCDWIARHPVPQNNKYPSGIYGGYFDHKFDFAESFHNCERFGDDLRG
jgi:hypothetical protein